MTARCARSLGCVVWPCSAHCRHSRAPSPECTLARAWNALRFPSPSPCVSSLDRAFDRCRNSSVSVVVPVFRSLRAFRSLWVDGDDSVHLDELGEVVGEVVVDCVVIFWLKVVWYQSIVSDRAGECGEVVETCGIPVACPTSECVHVVWMLV